MSSQFKPSPRVLTQLERIHAPVVVGVPPVNAFHDLVLLPSGAIRHYGYRHAIGETGDWVPLPLIRPSANGLSYLHLQSIADSADPVGTQIRDVAASVGV